jgi:DNA-binding transcriptional LysR family regulator
MTIHLHQLEGFYYTGLVGGYAAAAQAMPYTITAPAVYQQVRKLEGALGRPLVKQASARRTVLTPEGRILHTFVAPFFAGLPSVLEGIRRGEATRLVVAAHGPLAREVLVPALAAFHGRHPRAEVRVVEGDEHRVARLVKQGEADAGLAVLGATNEGLREEPLFIVRIVLLVPRGHALAKLGRVPRVEDLAGVPLCVYERGMAGRALLESAFAEAGVPLTIAAEASTAETLRALAGAGLAPAFLPAVGPIRGAQRRRRRQLGETLEVDVTALVPGEPVRYGLLTRGGVPAPGVVSELKQLLSKGVGRA